MGQKTYGFIKLGRNRRKDEEGCHYRRDYVIMDISQIMDAS